MTQINVTDILGRLNDLRIYSPTLSRKLPHEDQLPDDAAPFLINKIEVCFDAAIKSDKRTEADAYSELKLWITLSYRYYITRLALADEPWAFRFPAASAKTRH
jgi:hypothetical protein